MVTETWIIYLARGVVSKTGLFSNGVDLYFWGLTLWLALVIYGMFNVSYSNYSYIHLLY